MSEDGMMMKRTRSAAAFGGFAAAMVLAGAAVAEQDTQTGPVTWATECAYQICPAQVAQGLQEPVPWAFDGTAAEQDLMAEGERYGVVPPRKEEFNARLKAFWTVGVFR